MSYNTFTLSKGVKDFQLTIIEGDRFLPEVRLVNPSSLLKDTLKETLPWAIAVSSEQARSEGIILPVLLEVKRQLKGQISVFSGEEFTVQPEVDLTGYVNFLISCLRQCPPGLSHSRCFQPNSPVQKIFNVHRYSGLV